MGKNEGECMMKKMMIVLGMGSMLFANEAATLYNAKCAMCHVTSRPSNRSTLVAPPIMGVMNHVKMTYPNKEDAVKFIVDYVQNPSKSKAVCMPQKIQRIGLMPSQKGNVTPAELEAIASWLYDNYPPKGFRGRGMGGGGMGRGMGQGRGF
jgi:hypothetical protein